MTKLSLKIPKLYCIAVFIVTCSLFLTAFLGSLAYKSSALAYGDDVIPNGLPGVNSVDSFIARIESVWGSVGANAIVARLGGASIWKQNLSRVTKVEIIDGYTINSTSNIQNGQYQFGSLESSQNIRALIFYIGSKVYFVIDTACGNFTSEPVDIVVTPKWDLYAETTPSTKTLTNVKEVTVGTEITWTHKITNKGPDATHLNVSSNYGGEVAPSGGDAVSPSGVPKNGLVREYYTVWTPTEPGEVCETARYFPANSGGVDHWHGNRSCVTVVASTDPYTISAKSTVSQPTAIAGNYITWNHSVDNYGPGKTTEDIATAISPSGFIGAINTYPKTTPKGVSKGNIVNFKSDVYIVKKSDEGKTLCQSVTYNAIGGTQKGASTPACVKINKQPEEDVKTPCRPIQVTVPAAITYPAISHRDPWGRTYSRSTETIPVRATAKGSTVYTNNTTSKVIIDKLYSTNYITQLLTDGEPNTVYFSETKTHITGWTDHYVPDYDSPIYGYYPNYGTVCATTTVNGVTSTSCNTVITGYTKYIAGYNDKYSGTTTENYSGLVTSSEPTIACFDYKLDANINSFGSKVEAGASINISTTVDNTPFTQSSSFGSFYHTSSKSHPANWQISVLKLAPGQLPDGGFSKPKDQNSVSACSYFDPSGRYNCSSNLPGFTLTGNRVFWQGTSSVASINFIAPDDLAGTKYCFAFSVNDPQNADMAGQGRTWSHAAFSYANNCIVIVKKPKVQVWGGDLFVGRGSSRNSSSGGSAIKTSTSLIADQSSGKNIVYGSWGEYGIFAPSNITGMASGSFYKPSIPGAVNNIANDVCNYSKLTFTNAGSSACTSSSPKGYFSNSKKIPDVEATFLNINPSFIISNNLNVGGLSTGMYKSSTNKLSISGGTVPLGRWFIVYAPNATVQITGDIKYDNTSTIKNLGDIPQMIIIARDINIDDNVRQVDSWLIAHGVLNTCTSASPGSAGLKTTKCNNPLIINGQISAGKLYLHRTAGADPKGHTGDPAEILNLRADTYLWSYARATENGSSARVVYSTEMPVRF